jgi:hypothetical protein
MPAHRHERRGQIMRDAIGQTRMHANGGEHVRICPPQYHCHRAAGGQAGNIDALPVQAVRE